MRYRIERGLRRVVRLPAVHGLRRAIPVSARRGLDSLRDGDRALSRLDVDDAALVRRVKTERLTYLSNRKMANLVHLSRQLDRRGVAGSVIEAGCALGGSAVVLASTMGPSRSLRVHDVFGMIPPPGDGDPADVHQRYQAIADGRSEGLGGDVYYGYQDDLFEIVKETFARFDLPVGGAETGARVSLVRGLVQDTLHPEAPVALAHIDVDWYDPVMTCLERIYPQLATGGSIVFDDYFDWGGCTRAVDEFLDGLGGGFSRDDSSGALTVTKLAA